ncbi:MAG: metalloregulator ArsR/SmtB family transcription factor [Pyrinomonadaceae bacterium]|nr:metalloregulator ArsR/SmtB family transcription factor [Pyrinomonadaceae bacterium]
MSSEIYLQELETFFLALADKTRLRLLNLMRDGEVCVCFFTEVLGESQPKISRHLAYLRNAGLVEARRDGKWMHYRIVEPENEVAKRVLRETLDGLKEREEMQKDYENLSIACCGISVPVTISRAPKPDTFAQANMSYEREELDTFLL